MVTEFLALRSWGEHSIGGEGWEGMVGRGKGQGRVGLTQPLQDTRPEACSLK